jgi:hypothetical protein
VCVCVCVCVCVYTSRVGAMLSVFMSTINLPCAETISSVVRLARKAEAREKRRGQLGSRQLRSG